MRDIFTSDIISPLSPEKEGARVNKWLGVGSGFGFAFAFLLRSSDYGKKKMGKMAVPYNLVRRCGEKGSRVKCGAKDGKAVHGNYG